MTARFNYQDAKTLVAAAKAIRERAEAAAPRSGWTVGDINGWTCDGSWITESDTILAEHMATWNPKTAEAVASLLEVAAEDMLSAEIRGASWARWEWTHYCFAIAAQVLSGAARQGQSRVEYECPRCHHVSEWTDGIERGGNVPPEFWCQTCGAESPLEDCRVVPR